MRKQPTPTKIRNPLNVTQARRIYEKGFFSIGGISFQPRQEVTSILDEFALEEDFLREFLPEGIDAFGPSGIPVEVVASRPTKSIRPLFRTGRFTCCYGWSLKAPNGRKFRSIRGSMAVTLARKPVRIPSVWMSSTWYLTHKKFRPIEIDYPSLLAIRNSQSFCAFLGRLAAPKAWFERALDLLKDFASTTKTVVRSITGLVHNIGWLGRTRINRVLPHFARLSAVKTFKRVKQFDAVRVLDPFTAEESSFTDASSSRVLPGYVSNRLTIESDDKQQEEDSFRQKIFRKVVADPAYLKSPVRKGALAAVVAQRGVDKTITHVVGVPDATLRLLALRLSHGKRGRQRPTTARSSLIHYLESDRKSVV